MGARRLIGGSVLLLAAALAVPGATERQQPTFRSRITLVPVDVRVVDQRGQAVTGLRREDFTIHEDGLQREIVQFAFAGTEREAHSVPSRTFVLVIGEGRHVSPVKPVEAAIEFVRTRLRPRDSLAVIAYNRATGFTTEHERVVELLERYRRRHEDVDHALEARRGRDLTPGIGVYLGGKYGLAQLPDRIQALIDDIFAGPRGPAWRSALTAGLSPDSRAAGALGSPVAHEFLKRRSLDEFVGAHYGVHVDMANLFAALRYLRGLDGDKHLIYLTAQGLSIASGPADRGLAALAAESRVSIDVIHTGGMVGALRGRVWQRPGPRSIPIPSANDIFNQRADVEVLRTLASRTGGQVSAFDYASKAFARLDDVTRAQYNLAFEPHNPEADGRFRRIRVTVNRPGLTVLHRFGYVARPAIPPLDDPQEILYHRVAAALNMFDELDDVGLRIDQATFTPGEDAMELRIRTGPRGVRLVEKDGRQTGTIEAAYFCTDATGHLACERWQTLSFALDPDEYARFKRDGLSLTIRLKAAAEPRRVKVVVYEPEEDRLGSAVRPVVKTSHRR